MVSRGDVKAALAAACGVIGVNVEVWTISCDGVSRGAELGERG
jgi:hypothetical protein